MELTAGQTAEIDLELEIGLTVTGIVVDRAKVPVAGAAIEVAMISRADSFPEVVAITAADGSSTCTCREESS